MTNSGQKVVEMLEQLNEKRGWHLARQNDTEWRLYVNVGDGRGQYVWVYPYWGKDVEGNDMVEVISRACEIKKLSSGLLGGKKNRTLADSLTSILAKNKTAVHVLYALNEDDGHVVAKAMRMIENLSIKELETLIYAAAVQGDSLEKEKHADGDNL